MSQFTIPIYHFHTDDTNRPPIIQSLVTDSQATLNGINFHYTNNGSKQMDTLDTDILRSTDNGDTRPINITLHTALHFIHRKQELKRNIWCKPDISNWGISKK